MKELGKTEKQRETQREMSEKERERVKEKGSISEGENTLM